MQSRARNYDCRGREVKEDDRTWADERREFTHCIEGSGEIQEGSATLIKEKEQRGQGIEDEG